MSILEMIRIHELDLEVVVLDYVQRSNGLEAIVLSLINNEVQYITLSSLNAYRQLNNAWNAPKYSDTQVGAA